MYHRGMHTAWSCSKPTLYTSTLLRGTGVYGIAVWAFFQALVVLIYWCSVLRYHRSSSALCGFSLSLWLTVFGKRTSFICALLSTCLKVDFLALLFDFLRARTRVSRPLIYDIIWWAPVYDKIGRISNNRVFRSSDRSISGLLTFSRDGWGWFLVYICLR